jgi:hypothetical protein
VVDPTITCMNGFGGEYFHLVGEYLFISRYEKSI